MKIRSLRSTLNRSSSHKLTCKIKKTVSHKAEVLTKRLLGRTLIPKRIHYCWFGKGPKNEKIKKCIESWHTIMPDYLVKKWDESNFSMDSKYLETAYEKKLWSQISNYLRLWVLYEEGGLYFDTDIEAIKSFTPLLYDKCFLGFQQEEMYWNQDWVNNAVMGSIPKHPFLKRCLEAILQRFKNDGTFYRGPEVATKILKEMGLKEYGIQLVGDVKVYTSEFFHPYPWWGDFNPTYIKENTYCIHHWQLSWLKKKIKT